MASYLRPPSNSSFDVFVTTDQNLPAQQNLTRLSLAVVVLSTTSWPRIQVAVAKVQEAIVGAGPGSLTLVEIS